VMNAATSLPLPATKKNQNILEGNENKDFSFEVTRNGQNFFLGRCRIVNKSYKRSKLISMTLYLIGIGLEDEKSISVKGLEIVKKCDKIYLFCSHRIFSLDASLVLKF